MLVAGAVLAGLTSPATTLAQTSTPAVADSSARAILRAVGSYPDVPWLVRLLRQLDRRVPPEKLNEIADSLTARVLDASVADSPRGDAVGLSDRARRALVLASIIGSDGTPLEDGMDRLIRIHRATRLGSILPVLLALPDHDRALGYLREWCLVNEPIALSVVDLLSLEANVGRWIGLPPTVSERQRAEALLQALHDGGLVTDQPAAVFLFEWVSMRKQQASARGRRETGPTHH